MSVKWKAYAVYGQRLPVSALYKTAGVKAFEHDYPANWTYDPKTGQRLWTDEKIPIDGYNKIKGDLFGFEVFFGTGDEDLAYVGVGVGRQTSSIGRSDELLADAGIDEDIGNRMADLRLALSLAGLYDPKTFGLWAVLYADC
jgi:hypothetical protein